MSETPHPLAEEPPVAPGLCVELELISESGEHERLSVRLVQDRLADLRQGQLGEGTPLARAILGHAAGELLPYQAGDIRAVHILSVQPAEGEPDAGVAERRAETLRRAVRRSDLTNAIAFATSFNSKWGDYDPNSLSDELEDT